MAWSTIDMYSSSKLGHIPTAVNPTYDMYPDEKVGRAHLNGVSSKWLHPPYPSTGQLWPRPHDLRMP